MADPKWKVFEQDIDDYFSDREEAEPLTYHRFYDTASAGSLLPAQPGDFLIISRGRPVLLEAKHSTVHTSLKSCFSSHVKDNQLGFHRVWQRAGCTTFFIFESQLKGKEKVLELWDGRELVRARHSGLRLKLRWRLRTGSCLDDVLRGIYLNLTEERTLLI